MEYGQNISLFESEGSGLIWDGTGRPKPDGADQKLSLWPRRTFTKPQIIIGAAEASGPGVPHHTPLLLFDAHTHTRETQTPLMDENRGVDSFDTGKQDTFLEHHSYSSDIPLQCNKDQQCAK